MVFLTTTKERITRLSDYLAKPHILFYTLPWLMVLLVLGTVAQKDMGVYEATEKYFNSLILWLGPVPVPGGLLTLGVIFIALCIKFIFYSPWQWKKSGTILTHLGVLILLVGGILTSTLAEDGFMIIPEGQKVENISDYRNRVLVFKQNDKIIESFDFEKLSKDQILKVDNLKFKILNKCNNCGVRAPSGAYENLQGLAVNMELYPIAEEKNKEANFSGLIIGEKPVEANDYNTYMIMEDVPKVPEFKTENGTITPHIQRDMTPLPFAITLQDFRKIDYPGTAKPREFESDLIIQDSNIKWPATISMNKPLRYKGYVFYQSSFDQMNGQEVSVLNVVKNKGRVFPYIATLIIFIGLLLHFIIRLQSSHEATS